MEETLFSQIDGVEDFLSSQIAQVEETLFSQADAIENALFSALDAPCSSLVISFPQTLSVSGTYCLSQNIVGDLTIAASDIFVDFNNHKITGMVIIQSDLDQITLQNCVIDADGGENGIVVNSGSSNITIANSTIKNARAGISFISASNAMVNNCTLTQNTTGMQLNSSYGINVVDTVASGNLNAGFDLISSFTNSFINCKALATGDGNTIESNNRVAGFSSSNGYGNIFERCIANATQAFSTTDSNSLIAGFALQGTERCSKIISCESANAAASSAGVTVPYGIMLQATFDSLNSVTGTFNIGGTLYSVDWSPDQQYVAIGGLYITSGYEDKQVQICLFNEVDNSLTQLAGSLSVGPTIYAVSWSPDGQYLAVGGEHITDDGYENGGYQFQIFNFNRTNNSLIPVAGALNYSGDCVYSVDWSPDGQYVAIAGTDILDGYGAYNQLQIFEFNRINNSLTAIAGNIADPSFMYGTIVYSVNWSPDGQYIAISGENIADGYENAGDQFQIFQFDSSINDLIPVAGKLSVAGNIVYTVNWSPNGQYLALCGENIADGYGPGDQLQIFQFIRENNNLNPIAGTLISGDIVYSVNWSPDGNYVAVGGNSIVENGGNQFQIFEFDTADNNLTPVAGIFDSVGNTVNSVNWSPDGRYIVIAGETLALDLQIFSAFQFPSQNIISDNTVYCNGQSVSGPFTGAVGVGISGSSIANMIIGNTAYNNPPASSNFFVPSNYCFVTNVFNQAFGQGPTALQNISLNANDPIAIPLDIGLVVQQNQAKLCQTLSILDIHKLLLQSIIELASNIMV